MRVPRQRGPCAGPPAVHRRRFVFFWKEALLLFSQPFQAMFLGAVTMAFATIINGFPTWVQSARIHSVKNLLQDCPAAAAARQRQRSLQRKEPCSLQPAVFAGLYLLRLACAMHPCSQKAPALPGCPCGGDRMHADTPSPSAPRPPPPPCPLQIPDPLLGP